MQSLSSSIWSAAIAAAVTSPCAAQVTVTAHEFSVDFGVYAEWDEVGLGVQGPEFYPPDAPTSQSWTHEQGEAFAEARLQTDVKLVSTRNQWRWCFDVDFNVEARLGASPPTPFSTAEAAIWIDWLHLEFEIDRPHHLHVTGGVFSPRVETLDPGTYVLEASEVGAVRVVAEPGESLSADRLTEVCVRLIRVCRVDLDGSGELDFFDFLAFQNLFAAGDPAADFTGDGVLDFFDFLEFQDEFAAGCR